VALMRILEARLALLRRVLERCVAARERIGELARRAGLELERMEDGIAEGRHDVRVAELLKTEEVARLAALNARRDEIVAKHVPYLVLRRSRVFGEGAPLPGYALEPGTVADPVPACLEGEFEAPDQLRELVDLFSDAPVGWFPQVRAALDRLNRIDALNQTLQHAVIRARLEPPVLRAPFAVAAVAATPFGQRIQRVFTARHEAVRKERTRVAALDPARVVQATWAGARRDAERVVSIGDLIDAKHGRQDASRAAAAELENLYRVSACLFGRFRDVNPALRLLWAERYSQFDAPPDLRRLSGLERFDELPREDRRELQLLVDWLFQRVDGGIDDAVALMNDLVRVALLLASHAPVNQILEADVAPDQTAGVGGTLRVNVDIARVRIGMHVALFGSTPGQIVARGVVSDVGSGGASVRVLSANAVQVSPLRAQLSEPSRHAAALGPRAVSVGPAGIFEVEGR
jgi:hypothetical protein